MKKSRKPGKPEPVIDMLPHVGNEVKINLLPLKEKTLVWIFSILCSLVAYLVVAAVIKYLYKPDVALLTATADKLLIGTSIVRPEPMEALLFRAAVILIPLSLLLFYNLFSKKQAIKHMAASPFFNFFSSLSVAFIFLLVYVDFRANNPFSKVIGAEPPQIRRDFTSITNFDFYFGEMFLGNHLIIYSLVLVPLICCLFFIGMKKYKWEDTKLFNVIVMAIGYTVLTGLIICCVAMSIFYFPYQSENKYNFSAVYYSMTQVYAGVPLLVGGFTDTYGLYPHFLNPIFQVTGLSILKFSTAMALLIGISFVLNFYVLEQFVKNKVILFLGIFTVIFFPFLDFKFAEHFDANFAFHSIRYIIPSVLLFLSTQYLKKRSAVLLWSTFLIMAAFVLWNPEFGILTYLSWIIFLTFTDFYDNEGKTNYKKIAQYWLVGSGILIVVFYSYKLLILIFYRAAPDMSSLWASIFIFGKLGFGLLPMQLIHPWNLMALILFFGFLYSISRWYRKDVNAEAAIIFLLSILGVGFFFYFQGRSHNWNFAQSSAMSLLLLTILGDKLWAEIKNKSVLALNALFVLFLFAISFSFFEIVTNTEKLKEIVYQEEDKDRDLQQQTEAENQRNFIVSHSSPGQKVYLLTLLKFQALYFDGTKLRSAFNPGLIELFYNKDLVRLENQIVDSSFGIFITPHTFQHLEFMNRVLAATAATYEYCDSIRFICFLKKRKTKIPARVFFDSSQQTVFHRKYNDDKKSTEMRINDAAGIKRIHLNTEFSVQVLFDSKNQAFSTPTLIGNMPDTNGFVISRVLNSPNCLFGINGMGYYLPVPNNEWIYCVMNVFPDHFEVYINGDLLSTNPLPQPYKNSKDKLCIGNLGSTNYYVGAIAEVAISNTATDGTRIREKWNEINETLTDPARP